MTIFNPEHRQHNAAARFGMTLLRMSQAIRRLSQVEAAEASLTPVQAQTLLFVRYTKPMFTSVGRLAAALGTTHVSALGVIDGLIGRGLLTKVAGTTDRRVSLLRLTPEGEALCARLDRFGEALETGLAALDPEDLNQLERALGGIVWSLRAAGVLQVSEPCRGCVHFREQAAPGADEPHYCTLIERHLTEQESRLDCPDHTPPELLALPSG